MPSGYELEVVEEYELLGEKRFRIRVRGTRVYFNVSAETPEEAKEKAARMIKELGIDSLISMLKS